MSIIIYKATNIGDNPENGKSYIGFTKQGLNKRKNQHIVVSMGRGIEKNTLFHNAIKKYGFKSFSWKILVVVEKFMKCITETKSIEFYNTLTPNGYNSTTGGEGGFEVSKETRKKMSDSHKGKKHYNFGGTISEKQKRQIGDAHKGKKATKETKNKMSKSHKGTNNFMFGKYHSKDAKIKQSIAKIGKYNGENNPRNKYHFICTNNKDYWKDFTPTERISICQKFRIENTNTIFYKGITIERKLK